MLSIKALCYAICFMLCLMVKTNINYVGGGGRAVGGELEVKIDPNNECPYKLAKFLQKSWFLVKVTPFDGLLLFYKLIDSKILEHEWMNEMFIVFCKDTIINDNAT